MILALNCIVDEGVRAGFDRTTVPLLAKLAGRPVEIAYLLGGGELPGPERHTHLVISGSELSASRPSDHDDRLHRMIREFVGAGRAVLGLCYGHQVIAKALAGDAACRRAARPEFGWKAVAIAPDPLFDGIRDLIVAHSHYDEVAGLPPEFATIAWTDHCGVQAFALRGRPVWGLQFHPEMGFEQGQKMFAENRAADPRVAEFFTDELGDPGRLTQNVKILTNFFRSDGGTAR